MKILLATDGSDHSKKALEEAAKIAGGCNADEVAVINVYEKSPSLSGIDWYNVTDEDLKRFKKLEEQNLEERMKLLHTAVKTLQQKNVKARSIIKEGHPAETIARVAREGDYDLLVVGSRGLGGLKKLFLGSVSNALLQEAGTNVLVIK